MRRDAEAAALARGVPPQVADRIGVGEAEGLIHRSVLLEQVSVAEPGVVVKDLLLGTGVRITAFAAADE